MAHVVSVCMSEKKGTEKTPVSKIELKVDHGIVGDAHAGNWHRQVSLLSHEVIEDFKERGGDVAEGAFGENIITSGIDYQELAVGDRIQINDVMLELTQKGKECHTHCRIYHQVGDCIMPREGVFAKVLKGGMVYPNDDMKVIPHQDARHTAAVLTISDKSSQGLREDKSGPLLVKELEAANYHVVAYEIVSDDSDAIEKMLIDFVDRRDIDLIITSGGTGLSQRDHTPEATLKIADKEVVGISEALRAHSLSFTKKAMLSRGVSVIRKESLIINFPGSPKAVLEYSEYVLEVLEHAIDTLKGDAVECANLRKEEM